MENVWICDPHKNIDKNKIWDPICVELIKQGFWTKVFKRTQKPSYKEFNQLKKDYKLPDKIKKMYEVNYEILLKNRYELLDMLYRKTDWGTDRYNSASFHELTNRIRIYYDLAVRSLLKDNISLVVFWNPPHMGWDLIFYKVATYFKIKTLLLDQSKFPNRFFHFFHFDDYGTFSTSKRLENLTKYQIKKKVEKDWFYMKKNRGVKSTFSLKKLVHFSKYKNKIHYIFEKYDCLCLIRDLCDKKHRSQAFFRFYVEKNYKSELKRIISSNYMKNKNYVYFPLHKQPERSTAIWGGIYLDQVLAIERLSKLLPNDWYIYIKENPKQVGAYRDNLFFERLKQIPNMIFISEKEDTFKLMENSKFVATILGTAGWEAITGGINVLIFGWGAWYKTLPGVYEYYENMDISNLYKNQIDHEILQKKTAELCNKCGHGIINFRQTNSIQNFSIKKNTQAVVDSLKRILY